jgi:hypothetical protein
MTLQAGGAEILSTIIFDRRVFPLAFMLFALKPYLF